MFAIDPAEPARPSKALIRPANPERPPEDGVSTVPGWATIVNLFSERVVGEETAGMGRVTVPETIWPCAKVTVEPSLWRRPTVPVHGSIYISPWNMMSISGAGELSGGMLVGMLPGAPAGGGVITGIPGGTPDPEDAVDVGTSPANVNVSPSVVMVVGDVYIGTVSEPITTPDGPITMAEPSALVIVSDVEPIGIVVPLITIAGAVPEVRGEDELL